MSRIARALLALLGIAASGVLLALRGEAGRQIVPEREAPGRGTFVQRWLVPAAVLLAGLGVVGFLVVVSGLIPIKASSGHWAITRWFLDFAKVRAVSTQSLPIQPPPLDDPALILKGAGHYDFGCRPCHGDVERPQPKIPSAMTPQPPFLPTRVPRWEAEELFHIVKHGIKFTGMPAWAARERDDEVWSVTAFLLKLPEMSPEEYRQLVVGELATDGETASIAGLPRGEAVAEIVAGSCARCHGVHGRGRGRGAFPVLAGQSEEYLLGSLQAFARGERHSGIMEPLVLGLRGSQMRRLAAHYSRLQGLAAAGPEPDPAEGTELLELGRRIALEGIAEQDLPACADCHGPADRPLDENFPLLAGQYAEYIVLQLQLFKQRSRGGTGYAHLMHEVVDHLDPEQMRAVAAYFESLSDESRGPGQP